MLFGLPEIELTPVQHRMGVFGVDAARQIGTSPSPAG
jgi:hypothetical protein